MSEHPTEAPAEPWTPTPGVFWSRTAEQWRQMAADSHRRSIDSFERSDTDGFMTQYAADLYASKYHRCAEIAEAGGTMVTTALFDLDGNPVPARRVDTPYGHSWGLIDPENPEGRFTGWFNPSKASNPVTERANNAKKGYYVGRVRVRAALDRYTDPFPTPDVVEIVDNGTTIVPTEEGEQDL